MGAVIAVERSAFTLYRPPATTALTLGMPPRLESWDAKTAPSQVALGRYLDDVTELTRERLAEVGAAPLSLELAVAIPEGTDLLQGGYDLDNFLSPVVRRLESRRFASAWASKGRGAASMIRVVLPASTAIVLVATDDTTAEYAAAQPRRASPRGGPRATMKA